MFLNGLSYIYLLILTNENHGCIRFYDTSPSAKDYESAITFCRDNANGSIPEIKTSSDEQSIQLYAKTVGIAGYFWVNDTLNAKNFPAEPTNWKCDSIIDSHCFMSNFSTGDFFWRQYSVNSGLKVFNGEYFLSTYNGVRGKQAILQSGKLPNREVCLIFQFIIKEEVGTLRVVHSSSLFYAEKQIKWKTTHSSSNWTWKSAGVQIPPSSYDEKLFIIADQQGDSGEFALDNLRLKYGLCSDYQLLSDFECGDISYSSSGTIIKPEYPLKTTGIKSNCTWKILQNERSRTELAINNISLAERDKYCEAKLEVRLGEEEKTNGTFCLDKLEQNSEILQYHTNVLTLIFYSIDSWSLVNISWKVGNHMCSSLNAHDNGVKHRSCEDTLPVTACLPENVSAADCEGAYTTTPTSNSQGPFLGIVIGVSVTVVSIAIFVPVVYCRMRRRRKRGNQMQQKQETHDAPRISAYHKESDNLPGLKMTVFPEGVHGYAKIVKVSNEQNDRCKCIAESSESSNALHIEGEYSHLQHNEAEDRKTDIHSNEDQDTYNRVLPLAYTTVDRISNPYNHLCNVDWKHDQFSDDTNPYDNGSGSGSKDEFDDDAYPYAHAKKMTQASEEELNGNLSE